jgi:hypothetical protein
MGRLPLGAFLAFIAAAVAGPAGAAEVARVASSEPGNPFDLHVSIRWDREQERGKITREQADPLENPPFGAIVNVDELRYTRVRNVIVPRIALGLYRDVELHLEMPYVLADDHSWRFAFVNGVPVGGIAGSSSTVEMNAVDAMNQPCAGPCPLFPVAPSTTVYHGGRAGDAKVGLSWGVFNDRKDDTKPFWLVGFDVTLPTSSLYDPAAGRGGTSPAWISPHTLSGNVGAFGEKVWKWDLHTVLSRRIGPIDPYFKAHVTAMTHSSDTYSNCNHASEMNAWTVAQMTNAAVTNCADPGWETDAGAQLPWIAGLTFGTELVPYEKRAEDQKVTFDVRVWADYTSSQRFYNQLTDATGKLHRTEPYLTMGGFLGMYLRASRYVSLHAAASLATQTAHFLSGEQLGREAVGSGDVTGITANPNMNPNFDWRWDAPGRRFRITETSVFGLSVAGVLQF